MKKEILLIFVVLIPLFFITFSLSAQQSEQMTDPRDTQVYKTITITKPIIGFNDIVISQTWMAENLNYEMPDSWCYDDDPKNCEQYGRLYTWEAAKTACPEGWHLPTDLEWQKLMHFFGKGGLSYNEGDKQNYTALIKGGESGFSVRLGGVRDSYGEFYNFMSYGFFWSTTEYDAVTAWSYNFNSGNGGVNRDSNKKRTAFSCRCLQD